MKNKALILAVVAILAIAFVVWYFFIKEAPKRIALSAGRVGPGIYCPNGHYPFPCGDHCTMTSYDCMKDLAETK